MITLTVLSFNGAASDGSLSVAFDELGGSIGRADTNQMVLPDPERSISRLHAQVVYRNGHYALVDRGSNPVSVNGRPLGNGKEAPIGAGDQVQIGGYLIEVRAAAAASAGLSSDPFADLLGPAASPASGQAGAASADFDPLAGFGLPPAVPPAAASTRPSQPTGYSPAASPAPTAAPAAHGGIPDDWDPFAPIAEVPLRASGAPTFPGAAGGFGLEAAGAAPAPLIPELDVRSTEGSLDSLFGLKPTAPGQDPLGGSLLQSAAAQPNMAAAADPFASLSAAPLATAPTRADSFSDLQQPFIAPALSPAAPRAVPAAAPLPAPDAAAGRPAAPVLSWDSDDSGEGHTVIRPRASPAAASAPTPAAGAADPFTAPLEGMMLAQPAPAAMAAPMATPMAAPMAFPPAPAPLPRPSAAAAPLAATAQGGPAGAADTQALLAAFREGLASPGLQVPELTTELMRLVGQLLHEATQGTVELLVARAAMKREIRAETTMIMARENNPLKFSPSAEVALGHLLSPPARGFMPAGPAMRDAYDDLRAHQFGFVAGMRAALEGVLARFDPSLLEGRLTQLTKLQALLPGARKARLWEAFTELYAQIRTDAAEDFHTVFGKAFLKAYEEHIDQLQSGAER